MRTGPLIVLLAAVLLPLQLPLIRKAMLGDVGQLF